MSAWVDQDVKAAGRKGVWAVVLSSKGGVQGWAVSPGQPTLVHCSVLVAAGSQEVQVPYALEQFVRGHFGHRRATGPPLRLEVGRPGLRDAGKDCLRRRFCFIGLNGHPSVGWCFIYTSRLFHGRTEAPHKEAQAGGHFHTGGRTDHFFSGNAVLDAVRHKRLDGYFSCGWKGPGRRPTAERAFWHAWRRLLHLTLHLQGVL